MVDVDLRIGREVQSVELVGQQEDPLLDMFEFEIGLHQLVVERILFILVHGAVIGPVPRHELSFEPLRGGVFAHRAVVGIGPRLGLHEQVVQERLDRLRVTGHALLQHVVGIALVAQQIGDLQPRIDDPADQLRVVELAAQTLRGPRAPEFLLQFAVRGVGHEGEVARILQRDGPPLLAARGGLGGHPLPHESGQFGHHFRIGDMEREGVGGGQRILAELERQGREFGRILAVELLLLGREGGAVAGEVLVGLFEQHALLLREASGVFVDGLHAFEELLVERDVVLQFGQFGLHAQRDLLQLVRGLGAEHVEEDPLDAREQRAALFEGDDRIDERRFFGIVDDGRHLGPRAGDSGIEGRFIVFEFDLREGRRGVGGLPRGQQRIRKIEFGQLCLGNRVVGAACRQCGNSHDQNCFFHIRVLGFRFRRGGGGLAL